MDNNEKLFEGLLKADGINPAGTTESERIAFIKMLDEQSKSKQSKPGSRFDIWRIIIKSRITKLAASAACITIGIVLCLWLLTGRGIVQPAYAELVEILNNTNADWVHVVIQEYDGIQNDEGWTWVKAKNRDQEERWYSIHPFRGFNRFKNGRITLEDYANRRVHSYEPDGDTVTIEYDDAPDLSKEFRIQSIRDAVALSVPKDDRIIKRQKTVNGKALTVFYKETPGEGYEQWLVDPETQLVIENEEVEYEDNKKVITLYSYPETGPADIYELGVPRDVQVLNVAPPREIEDIVDNARTAEKNFSDNFFAIEYKLLDSFEDSVPLVDFPSTYMPFQNTTRLYNLVNQSVDGQAAPAAVITVTYRRGDKGRREIYPIWISEYSDMKDYQKQLKEVKKSIPIENNEALIAWVESRLPSQIIILNNRDMLFFQLNRNGTLAKLHPRYDPRDRAALLNINFWRPPNNRYDLDYYCQPLASQTGQWGRLIGIDIADDRYKCYFNPERDYICERVSYYNKPNKLAISTKNVLEYARTSNGHWYPKKTTSVQVNARYLFVSYIDDNYLIEDELFDEDIISASCMASFDSD
ncbi:MAG: hypothetical protein ACYTBV_13120 [Planctomycetota bacterium]